MNKPFLVALLAALLLTRANDTALAKANIAAGGACGIYVVTGNALASRTHSVNGVAGYKIERRPAGGGAWQTIALVEAPDSLAQFERRLRRFSPYVPDPFTIAHIPADQLWRTIERDRIADSLHGWSGVLLVRLAAGTTFLDTMAQRGVSYEYKVSPVVASGAAGEGTVSNPVHYPPAPRLAPLRLAHKKATEKSVVLEWAMGDGAQPRNFLVMRKDGKDEFQSRDPVRALIKAHDTTLLFVQDTLVEPFHAYQYYIVPADYYGNPGAHSDTVLIASYDFHAVPLPDHFEATGFDSSGGIRLRWRLKEPRLVKSVRIFRSMRWDTGYATIAEVSPRDSLYIDRMAEPMVKYFYYLALSGEFGESSPPSARVFGVYKSPLVPAAPRRIRAEGLNNGVKLQWQTKEKRILGYYVYRSGGYRDSLRLVAPLILADSVTTFYDTAASLSGKITYGYAVRAENTSHTISAFSDTVYVRPLIPTNPPAPMNLAVSVHDRSIQLYWDDMRPADESVKGYFIYRRAAGAGKREGKLEKLNDTLLRARQNNYRDTSAEPDKAYEYAVQSVDIFGAASKMSAPVRGMIATPPPAPPAGLRAERTPNGIVVRWDTTMQSNVVGFRVYRYERGKKARNVAKNKPDEREFTDVKALKGSLYFYYVTAVAASGKESAPSDEIGIRR